MPRGKKAKRANIRRYWANKTNTTYTVVFLGFIVAYLLLQILPQPNKLVLRQYHLTTHNYHVLLYPAIGLLVVSWLLSLVGSLYIRNYANTIRGSEDGKAFDVLSQGFLLLAIAQPFNSLLAAIFGQVEKNSTRLIPTFTIINNYVAIFLLGLSFLAILWGSRLLWLLYNQSLSRVVQDIWVLVFIAFSALYSYFVVIEPIHTPLDRRAYFLPNWLLVVSIVIPYLIIWYGGLKAAYLLYVYQIKVRGRIYKRSINLLAAGISVVILSSIATRVLTTISTRLTTLKLTPLLFIIYALIALIGLGFLLIALGARQLRRIEEV